MVYLGRHTIASDIETVSEVCFKVHSFQEVISSGYFDLLSSESQSTPSIPALCRNLAKSRGVIGSLKNHQFQTTALPVQMPLELQKLAHLKDWSILADSKWRDLILTVQTEIYNTLLHQLILELVTLTKSTTVVLVIY